MKPNQSMPVSPRVLRLPEVLSRVGRSRTSWYADVAAGRAPAPVRLGPRAVGWFSDSIDDWLVSRPSAR